MTASGITRREVLATPRKLPGFLAIPDDAQGLVLFAHGSGSSRFSVRNTMVANRLNAEKIATLLFDLLSNEESSDRRNVFDIGLLAGRLAAVADWARADPDLATLLIGYFGASTGAAAALSAAANDKKEIAAVVSRGGRPDLAPIDELQRVRAPTLLIVGSRDELVLQLNRRALAELKCEARLEVVQGATHLFEQEGTLEKAAELAADWFASHFSGPKRTDVRLSTG